MPAFSSQEIGSSLVSFEMIFEALQIVWASQIRLLLTEVETSKIPEFNLDIGFTRKYIIYLFWSHS